MDRGLAEGGMEIGGAGEQEEGYQESRILRDKVHKSIRTEGRRAWGKSGYEGNRGAGRQENRISGD